MRTSTPTRHPAPAEPARRDERGTALVLVPAMTLVLLCLGAIAIDSTLLHAAHRQVHRVASSAAEDAAAMIDEHELAASGQLRVDPDRANRVARAHLERASLPGDLLGVRVETGPDTVDLTVVVKVEHVLRPALRDGDRTSVVTVRTRGRLHP